LVSLFPNLIN